jgi:dolichol-phosphate mannosyltransferase
MFLLIIIPTYNEVDNITPLIDAVFAIVPKETEILVVDDNSPDGTAEAVEKIIICYPGRLHILKRPGKQGLATAYIAAFNWGLTKNYDVFLEMDADFSHKPEYIPKMLDEIKSNDVVIGSRNVKGGSVEGWSFTRILISKGGSFYSRSVLDSTIKDFTSDFIMWKKTALDKIGLENIISKGYSFLIEMKYRAYISGCSIKEIPILFPDRKAGKSKISKKIFFEAFLNVWKIKFTVGKYTTFTQFVKFALTGGIGTITNLILFFLFKEMDFIFMYITYRITGKYCCYEINNY